MTVKITMKGRQVNAQPRSTVPRAVEMSRVQYHKTKLASVAAPGLHRKTRTIN